MPINAFAAMKAKEKLRPFSYQPDELGPWGVEVQITHCGICHSDIHLIDDDWGMAPFPLVPGHEIVGTVKEKGSQVTHLDKGQRVGIGWQRSSCLQCEQCLHGFENLCANNQATCAGHYGGFADRIICDSRFAFAIPEGLKSESVGPLLCGGITVYSPLRNMPALPHMKVGVIGIGGLGHMALQFARARGCEVTAFSSSADKQKEAESFGAHHFVSSRDKKALASAASSLDLIISTVFVDLDWGAYLNVLKPRGGLCIVGALASDLQIPVFPLLMGQKSVFGSVIGSRSGIPEMLEFAARHQIAPQVEVLPISEVNKAVDRVRKCKARYRMVLEV